MNFIFQKNDQTFFLSDANSIVLISQVLSLTVIIEGCEATINSSMILKASRWLTKWQRGCVRVGSECCAYTYS